MVDTFCVCVDGVYVKDRKLFLVKRDVEPFKGFWHLVGGHVGENETLKEALRREFKEETNLDIVIGKILDGRIEKTFDRTKIVVIFEVTSAEGKIKLNNENQDYGWFNKLPPNVFFDFSIYIK